MLDPKNYHTSAAALIVAAAARSGLLKEVAEALRFIDKTDNPTFGCRACGIVEELTDKFVDLSGTPASVIEIFHLKHDVSVGPFTETELAPYLPEPDDMPREPYPALTKGIGIINGEIKLKGEVRHE
jgi:hypothetical protein